MRRSRGWFSRWRRRRCWRGCCLAACVRARLAGARREGRSTAALVRSARVQKAPHVVALGVLVAPRLACFDTPTARCWRGGSRVWGRSRRRRRRSWRRRRWRGSRCWLAACVRARLAGARREGTGTAAFLRSARRETLVEQAAHFVALGVLVAPRLTSFHAFTATCGSRTAQRCRGAKEHQTQPHCLY
jgi:hypothetical protein